MTLHTSVYACACNIDIEFNNGKKKKKEERKNPNRSDRINDPKDPWTLDIDDSKANERFQVVELSGFQIQNTKS